MRYYQECQECKDDMTKALCVYCEKPLIEADNLSKKLAAIEALAVEVLEELATMDLSKDTRHARYSQPDSKLIAIQILQQVRLLIETYKEKN